MYSSAGKAIITMPIKVIRQIEKKRQRQLERRKKFSQIYGVDSRTAAVVIDCKYRSLNHYAGQRYPMDRLLLATERWKQKKCDGDYFTIVTSRKISEYDEERKEKHPFEEMADVLSKPVLKAMETLGLKKMTPIQRKAFAPLVNGQNVFVSSEMGSGKTIAYLAPVVERLLRLRKSDGEPIAGCPRALVLSPTRELTEQLTTVSRSIIADTPPVELAMIRSGDGRVYANELEQPGHDLLIASVGAALRYRNLGALKFDDLRHVVVDEADTLLNESVRDGVMRLLSQISLNKTSGSCDKGSAQLILVASSVPDDLDHLTTPLLGEGNLMHLTNDSIHRLQPHLRHRFLRLDRKFAPEMLLSHVKRDYANKRRVVVFVRDTKTCEWLEHFLTEAGVPVVALRGTMADEERSRSYQRIIDGDFSVMVATDAAALGLDTRHLQHVINYQLPDTIGGYLRRAGRLGRIGGEFGRSGLVTTFVTSFWEVDFVQELEKSVRLNLPLNVNDIVRKRRPFDDEC